METVLRLTNSFQESTDQCRRLGLNPWSGKIPHASEQLSSCATSTEPALRAREPQQEEPVRWEAHAPQADSTPTGHKKNKRAAMKTQNSQK